MIPHKTQITTYADYFRIVRRLSCLARVFPYIFRFLVEVNGISTYPYAVTS